MGLDDIFNEPWYYYLVILVGAILVPVFLYRAVRANGIARLRIFTIVILSITFSVFWLQPGYHRWGRELLPFRNFYWTDDAGLSALTFMGAWTLSLIAGIAIWKKDGRRSLSMIWIIYLILNIAALASSIWRLVTWNPALDPYGIVSINDLVVFNMRISQRMIYLPWIATALYWIIICLFALRKIRSNK